MESLVQETQLAVKHTRELAGWRLVLQSWAEQLWRVDGIEKQIVGQRAQPCLSQQGILQEDIVVYALVAVNIVAQLLPLARLSKRSVAIHLLRHLVALVVCNMIVAAQSRHDTYGNVNHHLHLRLAYTRHKHQHHGRRQQ